MNRQSFIAIVVSCLFLSAPLAQAQECPVFTPEQNVLIHKAIAIGNSHNLGLTLAGIVWKESIVGQYIVRINATDGSWGSYGVGNMLLTTAMEMTGEDNYWRAKAVLAPTLINDDVTALRMSRDYLNRHADLGWRGMIAKYNGEGSAAQAYMNDVVDRVVTIRECFVEKWG